MTHRNYSYSDMQNDQLTIQVLPEHGYAMVNITGQTASGKDAALTVVVPNKDLDEFSERVREVFEVDSDEVPDVSIKFDPGNGLVRVGDGINTVVLHTSSDIDDLKQIRDNYIAGVAWLESELENALAMQEDTKTLRAREEIAEKFGFNPDSEVVRYIEKLVRQLKEKS